MLGIEIHNYPQGHKEGPYCPNSTLVEICNSLAGNNVTPKTFCTETIDNPRYSKDITESIESGYLNPKTSCSVSCLELVKQLSIVKGNVEGLSKEDEVNQRNDILKRWREAIFNITCTTVSDEKNRHFRRFNSADELSENEIIGKVEKFTESLAKIVGYKEGTYRFISEGADNCKQSPHARHFGSYD